MQQFQLKNVKIAMKHRGEKRKFTVFLLGFPFIQHGSRAFNEKGEPIYYDC